MLNDPTLATAVALALEKAINTALRYDPGTRQKLHALEECSIKFRCLAPEFSLLFYVRKDRIDVNTGTETGANVEVAATLRDFLHALDSDGHSYAESRLTISGKISHLNQLKEIISQLDIDWEEPLNEVFGTLPGHALAEALRHSWQWAKQQKNQFQHTLPHYLTEELQALPAANALHTFYNQVDEFRSRVERLGARVARLENKLTPSKKN